MVALFAALTATSCLYGVGTDQDVEVENTSGFKVEVSATVISSNGEDVAQFRALFNGEDVAAEATLYDAASDEPYEELSFSTYAAGTYQFYVTYGEYRSDVITVTAKMDIDLSDKQEEGLSVSLSTNLVQVGKGYAAFIVRYNGKVLTADEVLKLSIYDAQNDENYTIEQNGVGALFTYVVATDDSGVEYILPAYSPNQVGTKSFWVSYKKIYNTRTKPVQITAVNTDIPSRPVDLSPENLNFVHRTMLIQLTGIHCGYCPWLVSALHSVAEDENYNNKYVHTAVHGAAYDPLYKVSVNGIDLGELIHSGGYPYLYYDFVASHSGGYGVATDIAYIQTYIDERLKKPAHAAIAARTELKDNMLLVRASVKVNTDGEYYVGCWLLESNLYAQQSNNTEVREDYLDYHENVVRIADSCPSKYDCLGYPLGIINAGERADHLFVMELDPSWNVDNCHLVLFVTANIDERRTVTNVVKTSSLTSGVEFEY